MKRHLFTIALALFTAGPVIAADKHKHDDGDKHAKSDKHEKGDKHEKEVDEGTTDVEIQASELPAKVSEAFHKAYSDATVEKVKKETYKDGTIHYEIKFKSADGKKHAAEYNADGEELADEADHDEKK